MGNIQAAVLFEIDQPLRLIDLEVPELQPGQVEVDIAFSGVCHSQLNEVRGRKGPDRFLPHLLGHEGSGIVRRVGPGVRKVAAGDPVVLSWIRGSGLEVASTRYESPAGMINSGALSTFMRSTVTCENRVTPLPAKMPLREAALLGCAVLTGAGIVRNTARLEPGSTVAVFGVGGIGLSAVLAAGLTKPAALIAVDVIPAKLEQAASLGASHLVNAQDQDPVAAILDSTGGKGIDVAIEASGRIEAMEAAYASVRSGGGLCVIAGNPAHGERMSLDPFDLIRGKRLLGTWGGESDPDRDIPHFAELFMQGILPLQRLITHEYGLAQINAALDDLEHGKVTRALIDMTR